MKRRDYERIQRGMSSQTTQKAIQQKSIKPSCVLSQSILRRLFIDIS